MVLRGQLEIKVYNLGFIMDLTILGLIRSNSWTSVFYSFPWKSKPDNYYNWMERVSIIWRPLDEFNWLKVLTKYSKALFEHSISPSQRLKTKITTSLVPTSNHIAQKLDLGLTLLLLKLCVSWFKFN